MGAPLALGQWQGSFRRRRSEFSQIGQKILSENDGESRI